MQYIVPNETKSQIRIFRHIYLQDFMFLVVYAGLIYMSCSLVSPYLVVPYVIFAVVVGFYLVAPSVTNAKRRNWQAILITLFRDKSVYKAGKNVSRKRKGGN